MPLFFLIAMQAASTCVYAQQAPAQVPVQQVSAAPAMTPISEEQMNALADMLVPMISSKHFPAVTVFGGLGPVDELTTFGPAIGDAFSAALARRAQGFRVIDRAALRERLRQERVSDAMLLTNSLASWISQLLKAQGFVFVSFEFLTPASLTLTVSLTKAGDPEGTTLLKITAPIILDGTQYNAAKEHIYPFATLRDESEMIKEERESRIKSMADPNDLKNLFDPACLQCPRPEYPEWARKAKLQGEVRLTVTVMPDGKATDISVVRSAGFGFDEASVIAIRDWNFRAAKDKDGNAVSRRIEIEVTSLLF